MTLVTHRPQAATPDVRPFHARLAELALDAVDGLEAANEALYRAGLGDGLPLIPPTSQRVAAMLDACTQPPEQELGMIMPSFVAPTLRDVATCAVMAGCEARYLPVIAAALMAVAEPSFNLLGIQTTTGAATPLVILNGPVVDELGINVGSNALGQGARANATIGRAMHLVLQNVGLAIPGTGDMATHGQPGKYGWCLAEHEADSPWPPFHTDRGFDAATSTVTAVGAVGSAEVVLSASSPEELVTTLAHSMTLAGNMGSQGTLGSGQALVLLPPESARMLSSHGWDRPQLQQALLAEARLPSQWLTRRAAERASAELRPGEGGHDGVPVARSAADILIVVTGGVGIKATFIPTWGGGTEAITREIEPL